MIVFTLGGKEKDISRYYHSKQSGDMAIFDIDDNYNKSFKDIEKNNF